MMSEKSKEIMRELGVPVGEGEKRPTEVQPENVEMRMVQPHPIDKGEPELKPVPKLFDDNKEVHVIPRIGLRESSFRAFEHLIAKVVKYGTIEVNPKDFPMGGYGMNATTFASRFKDAMLGYEKFKYKSRVLPEDFDRRELTAEPLSNGNVRLVNKLMQASVKFTQRSGPDASNRSQIIAKVKELLERKKNGESSPATQILGVSSQEQANEIARVMSVTFEGINIECDYSEVKQWVTIMVY